MSLRHFMSLFPDTKVIERPVRRELEITRILREDLTRIVHFKNLDGHEAVGNLWSTRERIAKALGFKKEHLLGKMLDAIHHPQDFEVIERAPFMENELKDFDLGEDLPIPKWYPRDAGHYLTSAVVIAELDGKRNMSFHRMLVIDEKRAAARLVPRHLYAMHRSAMERGEELRVGIAIGACPWILLAAGMSVEFEADELKIASALRQLTSGEMVKAVKLRNGITVPAFCEYMLEGRITHETHKEGPFVDVTNAYDKVRDEPVIEIDKVYHRDNPVYHALLSGGYEHYLFMGMPREPMVYEAVKRVVPHVAGVRLTEGGAGWLHGVVSIRKQRAGDGKNAILAAFSAHASMKMVTIVDEDIDIYNDRDVEWAVATRFQADKDLVVISGVQGSSIDPSAGETTAKMGLDATKPLGRIEFEKARL